MRGNTCQKYPKIPWKIDEKNTKNTMKCDETYHEQKTEIIWNPQHRNWWWLCWIGGPLPHLEIVTFLGKMVKIINTSCQDATAKYKRLVEYSYFISSYLSSYLSIYLSIHPCLCLCLYLYLVLYLYLSIYIYISQCDAGAIPNSQFIQTFTFWSASDPIVTPRNIENFRCHPPSLHRENSPIWCLGAPR